MKSHVSDYLEVMYSVYKDACIRCSAKPSYRDLKTIKSRVHTQGLSFLTITLPNFCRDFERSLDLGQVDPTFFQYFRKNGAIPAFLQGLLDRVFDKRTGRILDNDKEPPTAIAGVISSVRQICLTFKKIRLSCSSSRIYKAIEAFAQNELSFNCLPLPAEDDKLFKLVSSVLWGNILNGIKPLELTPRHGPGQTAERISGNRKFAWSRWHDRLEPYFPLLGSAFPISIGIAAHSKEFEDVQIVSEEEEQPVRVVLVPKTLKAPRVIAIEPCCMQYTQQAISRALVDALEHHPLTRGHINFRNQEINQRLALSSSKDGQLATIDLSDASDRVPVGYALDMFSTNPDLKDAVEACRSKSACLPDGRIVHLRKFASMGSALCFPVEAMYFYTICVVALLRAHNLPVSHRNVFSVSRDIYVYGDDILVPQTHAESVLDHLRKYNCKVNTTKTFYTGKFRESCGVDAYNGSVVTPIYINEPRPKNRRQASEIISWVSTANQFARKGYVCTASYLYSQVERILGSLPHVQDDSSILGRILPGLYFPPRRWNSKYQSFEIKGWQPRPVYRIDKLDGYAGLSRSLLALDSRDEIRWRFWDTAVSESEPLDYDKSALHGKVTLNRRWVPASKNAG